MSKPKKPTGTIHRAVITPRSFTVERIDFPSTKEAIESLIVERYMARANSMGIQVSIDSQNGTESLDFNATVGGKRGHVELTEIAPLGKGGYEAASQSYEVVPFAEAIAAQIAKKSAKYAGIVEPIVLLMYITDWHFPIADQVIEHLQFLMREGKHGFVRIDILEPMVGMTDSLHVLYPQTDRDWSMYSPNKHAAMGIAIANVAKPLPRDQWPDAK